MGNGMNKPLLSLLGATFVKTEQNVNKELSEKIGAMETKLQNVIDNLTLNISNEREVLKTEICKQTRCDEWTGWSSCSAHMNGTFGARKRSRKCGGNSSICSKKSAETDETENQICQGTCSHTLTTNYYCIKMYHNIQKTQKDAQDDCHKDGGHLMNVDSALKVQDVSEYFKDISFTSHVWNDGKRTLPNGDWKYEYGSKDTTFSIWASSSEPVSSDDCKIFNGAIGKWHGSSCASTHNYLCEIV